MSNIVFFIFAGRKANLEVQKPYLDHLLAQYPDSELHLWDLTRNAADAEYLRTLVGAHGGRVQVLSHLHTGHPIRCTNPTGRPGRRFRCVCMKHKPPYEKPYQWYAANPMFEDSIFVKMDDDVLFLETDRFDDLIAPLTKNPNAVISANVVNNVVCAKYDTELANRWIAAAGNPRNPANDKNWWALHCNADFAVRSHSWFLEASETLPSSDQPEYVRPRPGEAVSINCIAFTHATMKRMASAFLYNPRLGDEGVVDSFLPWICQSFYAAHLTFGPQDAAIPDAKLNDLRDRYAGLAQRYLNR